MICNICKYILLTHDLVYENVRVSFLLFVQIQSQILLFNLLDLRNFQKYFSVLKMDLQKCT